MWKRTDDELIVTQLSTKGTPRFELTLEIGRQLVDRPPFGTATYPLALRLALSLYLPEPEFPVPDRFFRSLRLWPPSWPGVKKRDTILIDGHVYERRISGTHERYGDRYYAEMFLGRAHETDSRPRSLIFAADARHLLWLPDRAAIERTLVETIRELLQYGLDAWDFGLDIDPKKRLHGRKIAKVVEDDGKMLRVAITLPQPGGDWKTNVTLPIEDLEPFVFGVPPNVGGVKDEPD